MKFLSGILLGIFSIVLILVQGLFVTWSITYPEGLFFSRQYLPLLAPSFYSLAQWIRNNKNITTRLSKNL